MPKYRFSCLGPDGKLETSSIIEVKSDAEVRDVASNLLRESPSEIIEVWDSLRLVHRAAKARAA